MNPADFQILADLLKDKSGLMLSQDKSYLLESRLAPLARTRGLTGVEDLTAKLKANQDKQLITDIVEAMTTNESLFFRDTAPFEQFKDVVLPQLMEARKFSKTLRIWSAACSSGQEPYSLSMLLRELGDVLAGWRVEIIGTDLSSEILSKAKSGVYTQFEVQRGLPITMLVKYFKQDGDQWIIDSSIRSMVQYRQFNLLDSMASLGEFDMVFCRNVLIYFDNPTKGKVLEQMNTIMRPHAYLFLGGAETVIGITDKFKPVIGHRGIYELS
ncbi:MAG: protein-glutamate O-methyltransferase [Rhodospirillaceae bacterium]|jgi:chemotaxis protein methyltransferase CheR|nr:protein-glutamate O-methyltransferase [Rhodospirillaceae bacterium]MBT5664378.1 protein-glutamate O-methyltransferase [Rhodospirillaceae bacterium]